jgi:hypothetical protein
MDNASGSTGTDISGRKDSVLVAHNFLKNGGSRVQEATVTAGRESGNVAASRYVGVTFEGHVGLALGGAVVDFFAHSGDFIFIHLIVIILVILLLRLQAGDTVRADEGGLEVGVGRPSEGVVDGCPILDRIRAILVTVESQENARSTTSTDGCHKVLYFFLLIEAPTFFILFDLQTLALGVSVLVAAFFVIEAGCPGAVLIVLVAVIFLSITTTLLTHHFALVLEGISLSLKISVKEGREVDNVFSLFSRGASISTVGGGTKAEFHESNRLRSLIGPSGGVVATLEYDRVLSDDSLFEVVLKLAHSRGLGHEVAGSLGVDHKLFHLTLLVSLGTSGRDDTDKSGDREQSDLHLACLVLLDE